MPKECSETRNKTKKIKLIFSPQNECAIAISHSNFYGIYLISKREKEDKGDEDNRHTNMMRLQIKRSISKDNMLPIKITQFSEPSTLIV